MAELPAQRYGYDLEPGMHAALRGLVPDAALTWVQQATGDRVLAQQPLAGGTSSAVHLLTLDGAPPADQVVLRRYVLDWVREEPEIPGNEALSLRLLADGGSRLPTPSLIASDPLGSELGCPPR